MNAWNMPIATVVACFKLSGITRCRYEHAPTAASAANLVNLISQTQNTFNEIMNLQLPEIVPFENAELAMRFEEISNRMIESYEGD